MPRSESGETLRVPWVGFKTDYQSIKVLTDASCGLPALVHPEAQRVEGARKQRCRLETWTSPAFTIARP